MATRVLVQGWRGINHSYALVNQYQLLELVKYDRLRLSHEDLPLYPHWSRTSNGGGFDERRTATIAAIPGPDGSTPDVSYRIGFPFRIHGGASRRIFSFATLESRRLQPNDIYDGPECRQSHENHDVQIVTPSRWSQQILVSSGFSPDRVHVVPHGVDPSIFRPLPADERAQARRDLGLPPDRFVFLNVSAMVPIKGIEELLAAFDTVHRKHPHALLLLKDLPGTYTTTAIEVIARVRASGRLGEAARKAIGTVSANFDLATMRLLYGAVDAYVSPYLAEGFNLPPLEAAACGTPILVTAGGATDDYVHPSFARRIASTTVARGDTVLLQPDQDSLVAEMEALAQARGNFDRDEAMAWIGQNFTWARAVEKLVALFES